MSTTLLLPGMAMLDPDGKQIMLSDGSDALFGDQSLVVSVLTGGCGSTQLGTFPLVGLTIDDATGRCAWRFQTSFIVGWWVIFDGTNWGVSCRNWNDSFTGDYGGTATGFSKDSCCRLNGPGTAIMTYTGDPFEPSCCGQAAILSFNVSCP